ncbi:hypothetical protein PRIPAC_95821 [Pristionchus pacificus]|uniref:Uncharacterized protein n=1 Tax=Pristionchus pacificus TaxID=54126 RepID=A0A2A6D1G3_PRIPA|nr:hypothetical protein PRIPAC_95821 [Pristionchus pacificus]|eukprot:PDM84229.1 hypothetical protein PRIPAC_33252 [Pristionchus pacificus]
MLERIHAKAQAESADQKRSFSVQQTSLNANRSRTLHSIHSTTFLTQASPLHTWTILFNPITLSHLPCSPRDFRRQKRVVPSYGISSYELALIHRAHAKGLTVEMEQNFGMVTRLLAEVERSSDRVARYKNFFTAMERSFEALDSNQRAWYTVQKTARDQYILSISRLRELTLRCTEVCTLDCELQQAHQYAENCTTAYARMDFNKYDYYCTLLYFV